jgi:hypothetical protein
MTVDHGGEVGQWGRPYQPFGKSFRRRKRKRTGAEIDAALKSAELGKAADKGLLCRGCGKRRAWKDIYWQYVCTELAITRLWFCSVCGNQLKEDEL